MAQLGDLIVSGTSRFLNKINGDITGDAGTVNNHTVDKDVPSNAIFTDTTYSLEADTTNNKIVLKANGTAQNNITVPYATSAGTATDNTKVLKAGDTMTGNLILTKSDNQPKIMLQDTDGLQAGFKMNNASGRNVDVGWDWSAGAGAGMALRSSGVTGSQQGAFVIYARKDTSAEYPLVGLTDGKLTWCGNRVLDVSQGGTIVYCDTAANQAAKVGKCSTFQIYRGGSSFLIYFTVANTYEGALTLNINGKGAKQIKINGVASSSTNYSIPAGMYLAMYGPDGCIHINTESIPIPDGGVRDRWSDSNLKLINRKYSSDLKTNFRSRVTGATSTGASFISVGRGEGGDYVAGLAPANAPGLSFGYKNTHGFLCINHNSDSPEVYVAGGSDNALTWNSKIYHTKDRPVGTYYGTCDTAAGTAIKVVTISDDQNFVLQKGCMITVKFDNSNSASNVTLNVNSSGDKSIYYNGAVYTDSEPLITGFASRNLTYMYNGSQWVWVSCGVNASHVTNTTANTDFRVLLSGKADDNTEIWTLKKASAFKFNPSTETLTVPHIVANTVSAASGPIYTNTYTDLIGSANDAAGASFYFGHFVPDNYYDVCKIHFRFTASAAGANQARSMHDCWVELTYNAVRTYANYNTFSSTDYRPLYFINVYRANDTGIGAGYGHLIGAGLRASWNPTTAANARTIKVEILEVVNGTYTPFETALKYANVPGTGSTNYSGLTELNGYTQGLQETGDANDNTYDKTRFNAAIAVGSTAIVAKNIIVADTNSKYTHLKLGNAFDITAPILYANSAIAANATGSDNYYMIPFTITTTQSITLTANKPVYIKGTLNGKMFTPISTTPLTQTEPITADGYQYMLLGFAYSTTAAYLIPEHKIFAYQNGAFGEYVRTFMGGSGGSGGSGYTYVIDSGEIRGNDALQLSSEYRAAFDATNKTTIKFDWTMVGSSRECPGSSSLLKGNYLIPNITNVDLYNLTGIGDTNLSGSATVNISSLTGPQQIIFYSVTGSDGSGTSSQTNRNILTISNFRTE